MLLAGGLLTVLGQAESDGVGGDGPQDDGAIGEFTAVGVDGIALVVIDDNGILGGRAGHVIQRCVNPGDEGKKAEREESKGKEKAFGGHGRWSESSVLLPVRNIMTEIR